MAFEEKKYLDVNGVGIIKSYIDQQDGFKVDKTTYEEDINKAETGLKAQVAANAAGVAANSAAVAKAQEDATKANTDLATEIARAKEAEGANAQAAAGALAEAQAKVASVAAADNSIAIAGTATAPTVGVKLSTTAGNNLTVDENGLYVNVPVAAEYNLVKDENSGDYAAVYHLTKDGANIGAAINIPKDLVVKSGSVQGDKIILVLNDEANTEIEINVGSLIEYVTSGSNTGDMVVINIDDDHKVTATITDGTVTKEKLVDTVQTSLNKADSALQVENIATGATNGTIKVKDTEVAVAGLGSAAYTEASAYDAAGSAQAVYNAIVPLTDAEVKAVFGLA